MFNVTRLSFEEFLKIGVKKIVIKNEPAIIEIPCEIKRNFTLDKIEKNLASTEINLFQRPKTNNVSKHTIVSKIKCASLLKNEKYFDENNNDECFSVSSFKDKPEKIKDILGFNYQDIFKKLAAINLWINYINSFSSPHFDDLENFNIQLVGTKRFVLYKPGIKNYYIRPLLKGVGHSSKIFNFERVDFDKYPNFKNVINHKVEIILKSGEMLYLPFAWWHQVYSLDPINININFWFLSSKILTNPYVLFDSFYKNVYRKIKGIYNYN